MFIDSIGSVEVVDVGFTASAFGVRAWRPSELIERELNVICLGAAAPHRPPPCGYYPYPTLLLERSRNGAGSRATVPVADNVAEPNRMKTRQLLAGSGHHRRGLVWPAAKSTPPHPLGTAEILNVAQNGTPTPVAAAIAASFGLEDLVPRRRRHGHQPSWARRRADPGDFLQCRRRTARRPVSS